MAIQKPYHRTCRPYSGDRYPRGGYLRDPRYATAPERYIRAFLLLQQDLQRLFEYVEPADDNLTCYSFRIHELLVRACIEVEASCKAILKENGYRAGGRWSMNDYIKVEQSHRLSQYRVMLPVWEGRSGTRWPFKIWMNQPTPSRSPSPPWYKAYNAAKHNRANDFSKATLEHMTDAIAAVVALLSSQFSLDDFQHADTKHYVSRGDSDNMFTAIGGYFRVGFPRWTNNEYYGFDWGKLHPDPDAFQRFDHKGR